MSKKNIDKILFWIIFFSCLCLVMVSMLWSPRKQLRIRGQNSELLGEFDSSDITEYSGCSIQQNGQINVNGPDAHIVFRKEDVQAKTIVVNFNETITNDLDVQLYLDYGNDFNEADSLLKSVFAGEKNVGFEIPEGNVKQIRLDIDSDYNFDSLEIYSGNPVVELYKDDIHYERIFLGVILSVLICFGLFIIDKRIKYSDKFIIFIKSSFKIIIRDIALCVISLSGGWIISFIINEFNFKYSVWIFSSAIIAVILFAIVCYKSIEHRPEALLIRMIFISSMAMLFISPIGHVSWDIDSHFKFALESSSVAYIGISEPELAAITNGTKFLQNTDTYVDSIEKIDALEKNDDVILKYIRSNISISSLPSGIIIAILRLFGASFFVIYKFGQIPIVIVYSLCCYFAMRRLHSGKMILAVVAMFPTSLFIASNYSYDTWVIGFSMVGMAYFVGNCQEQGNVSTKDAIIMVLAFAIAIIPKQIYLAFLVIPFLMKREKIANRKKYYGICSMAFVVMLLDLIAKTIFETSKGGDVRGGAGVNPMGQISYIMHNPLEYTHTLMNFLKDYLSIKNMNGYIDNFAYLGFGATSVAMIIFLCMIIVTFTDKRECDVNAYTKIVWGYDILMYFGSIVLIATSLYIAYTEVGALSIAGCQSRYITPLVYPLLSIIGLKGLRLKIDYKIYNYIVLGIMQSVNLWCIYQYILIKML